jgi:protein gp37
MMKVIENCPQHTFQLLTKNPKRYKEFEHRFSKNVWVGASVTCNDQIPFIEEVRNVKNAGVHFISFEPLLEALDLSKVDLTGIEWCIVGAESVGSADNPRDVIASQGYAAPLIKGIRDAGICLFTKPNLRWEPQYKCIPTSIGRSCP